MNGVSDVQRSSRGSVEPIANRYADAAAVSATAPTIVATSRETIAAAVARRSLRESPAATPRAFARLRLVARNVTTTNVGNVVLATMTSNVFTGGNTASGSASRRIDKAAIELERRP